MQVRSGTMGDPVDLRLAAWPLSKNERTDGS